MALIWADRVRETSSTSGTGAITPTGAYDASFRTIGSVLSSGDTAYFGVRDGAGAWNVFLGTWNGTNVARTTVLSGSSGTSAVSLSGTAVEIWIDAPADWIGTRVDTAGAAAAAPVASVAGRTGAVVLAAGDIASGTLAAARLPLATGAAVGGVQVGSNIAVASGVISIGSTEVIAALGLTPVSSAQAAAAAPVQSVAGRTGTVTLTHSDITDFGAWTGLKTIDARGTVTTGQSLDLTSSAGLISWTAGGNITLTVSAVPSGYARGVLVKHTQDGTGTRTLTVAAGGGVPAVKYAGGSAPDYSARTAGEIDVVMIWSDGTDLIVSPAITKAG